MAKTKKIYLFANWKMYLDLKESVALAKVFGKKKYSKNIEVAIFPSALALTSVRDSVKKTKIALGAQNTYWIDRGGYTGEVSAQMFKGAGCKYSLVGHAERRHVFHESNHEVRQKLESILSLPFTPVICVGETAKERKSNQTEEVLEAQIRSAFMNLSWPDHIQPIIAYEPVWAIGTGETCEPDEAERVSALIYKWTRELLRDSSEPVILYGGSVRGENIAEFLDKPQISGVLVGGASTKSNTWTELVDAIN